MVRAGILCNENHEVLSEVAEILEERGVKVDFIDPDEKLEGPEIADYDLVMPKKSREAVYHNMRLAEELGLETMNGFVTGMSTDHNLASIRHLERSGFRVPEIVDQPVKQKEYIEKPLRECYREEPRVLNGHQPRENGFFLEEYIESDGTDYKLYLIDSEEPYVAGVKTKSKLIDGEAERESFDPSEVGFDGETARNILSAFYDADFLGVDIIRDDNGEPYIVDVNAAPSFRRVDDAPEELADAVYARI